MKDIVKGGLNAVTGGLAGGLVDGVMGLFGGGSKKDRKLLEQQFQQQKELMGLQGKMNEELMGKSYEQQKAMYDHTYNLNRAEQQVRNLKEAGLNPALAMGLQGAGGGATAGSGGAAVGGGAAPEAAAMQQAGIARQGMALQMSKVKSEIDVNKSIAERNRADAESLGANTETTNKIRNYTVELEKQKGIKEWLDNARTEYMNESNPHDENEMWLDRNATYNTSTAIMKKGGFNLQMATEIAEGLARTDNANASAALTNEKTKGYWKELLNETVKAQAASKTAESTEKLANNDAVKAAAIKLAAEFNTGEFTNWKTWVNTGMDVLKAVGGIAK